MAEHIAVIGAGPAGASAAHALCSAKYQVTVFERDDAIGGRTRTLRTHGYHLDTGAGFITNFYPRVMTAAQTLGFDDKVRLLERVTGLHDGKRLARLNVGSPLSFMSFPLITWADKLKMSAWTSALTLKRSKLDLARPETLCTLDHQSIAEYARHHLNERIYQHLIRPGIEPFWYFSCEEVSAALAVALTAHAAGAQFYFVEGGIDQICSHLLAGSEVQLSASVSKVWLDGSQVRLETQDHQSSFDGVVVATPATAAVSMTQGAWQQLALTANQQTFLREQRYAANVHVAFRIPRLAKDPGVNSVFPTGAGPRDLAALSFHRRKGGQRDDEELVSVYLSDAESRRVLNDSDEQLAEHSYRLAKRLYPALGDDFTVHALFRRSEAIPLHAVGRYRQAQAFHADQDQAQSQVTFCGDYLASATIEGAVESGARAAKALIGALSR
ncbi:MAG TPA: hypothetical protein DCQ06_04915 [Myxococcales bacterium]|nr:hypothetical protein [Myxococcales bacterium]